MGRPRSWLFVPADRVDFLARAFTRGADVVVLDLEDGVAVAEKTQARARAAKVLDEHSAWVRVNRPMTAHAERDLTLIRGRAAGVRVPKVNSAEDAAWVVARVGGAPVTCTIESAHGLVNCLEIAQTTGVVGLVFGAEDYCRDVGCSSCPESLRYARSHVVAMSRAGGLAPPVDGAYPELTNVEGLERACREARALGFGGKSVVHPDQIPVVNTLFAPTENERQRALRILAAFADSDGRPVTVDGMMVDRAVADRARLVLEDRHGNR